MFSSALCVESANVCQRFVSYGDTFIIIFVTFLQHFYF